MEQQAEVAIFLVVIYLLAGLITGLLLGIFDFRAREVRRWRVPLEVALVAAGGGCLALLLGLSALWRRVCRFLRWLNRPAGSR